MVVLCLGFVIVLASYFLCHWEEAGAPPPAGSGFLRALLGHVCTWPRIRVLKTGINSEAAPPPSEGNSKKAPENANRRGAWEESPRHALQNV